MSKIIVSYRRSDSAAITGRIFDRLIDRYGEELVFMDIDRIPFGTDFRHHIQDALRDADVLLAVVGPAWLGKTPDGRSRIQDEADPVRVEIETALRQGLTVIPVLVDNAPMPGAADLPESIRDFAYINAAPIDVGRDFRAHMERLTRSIDGLVGPGKRATPAEPSAAATGPTQSRGVWRLVLAAAVLLVGATLAFWPGLFRDAPPPAKKSVAKTADSAAAPEAEPKTAPDIPAPPLPVPMPANAPATYRVLSNVSGGVQNLRSGPALKYPVVVAIPAGAAGIALGACFAAEDNTRPWCAATWGNHAGFISSCCIVNEKTGAPPKVD